MSDKILIRQTGFDSNYKTWHTNGNDMLIYTHSNGGSIVCNEKIYPIKSGVLCFIGAKKYHYTMPDETGSYQRSKVFAESGEFKRILSHFPESFAETFGEESFVYAEIPEADRPRVEALFDEMALSHGDPIHGEAVFASCFTRLLVYISQNAIDAISLPHGFMHKAVEYVNQNICTQVSIESICARVHMSKYHFCRSFKKATGLTVMEYVLKTRLILAQNMLKKENLAVSEVSERCGFSSVSYFCRVFKEEIGVTPLAYRRLSSPTVIS